jgi:N-acetylmuramoyl-L-alanine amidase
MYVRKYLFWCICLLFALSIAVSFAFDIRSIKVHGRSTFCVVIDAGHGGRDLGASGPSGTTERDINLRIARFLKADFEARGVKAVLTRKNDFSLADINARNQKKSDMEARRKIIEKTKPDLVISIHLNTYPNASVRGMQTFYAGESSKKYADAIQTQFNNTSLLVNRRATQGDYFILDCTAYPSVLVECGFLSNAEEEELLDTQEYQKMIAQIIAKGVTGC